MKTLMTKRTILIGFAAALASTTFVACSGASSATSSGEGSANDEHTGKIGAQLTLPGGESIGSIAYTLQGPKTYSATVDVSGTASTFSFVISNVVPGTGYTITLSATSADGEVACKGTSASFSVTANQTTAVNVLLACNTRLEAGSVLVSGGCFGILCTFVARAEIFDPASQRWVLDAPLITPRESHSAALLADGRVLVAGGYNSHLQPLTSAELYTR